LNDLKRDFVKPILVLSFICLFITGALAIGNTITQPVIKEASDERAREIKRAIFPDTDEFVLIENEYFPRTITEVFAACDGNGYIFMIKTYGYGGYIEIICGIDTDGRIVKTVTLAESETRGIATPVFDMQGEYIGKDKNLEGIDAVSGATITSNAYINGVLDAFEAFEMIGGEMT
jgi:electron transport complex protein RnfG